MAGMKSWQSAKQGRVTVFTDVLWSMIRGSWKDKTCQKTWRTAHQSEVERWQWSKDGKEKRNPAVQEEEVRSSLLIVYDLMWVFTHTLGGALGSEQSGNLSARLQILQEREAKTQNRVKSSRR